MEFGTKSSCRCPAGCRRCGAGISSEAYRLGDCWEASIACKAHGAVAFGVGSTRASALDSAYAAMLREHVEERKTCRA